MKQERQHQMFQNKIDIVYSDNFSQNKYNFLYLNDDFLDTLQHKGQVIIEGQTEEDAKFYGDSTSFQLVNVKFLNMLLLNSQGQILRQGNNYLKVENRQPETHDIYDTLREQQLTYKHIKDKNIQQIVNDKGLKLDHLCKTFKISPKEFTTFAQKANFTEYDDHYLIISFKAYNQVFHTLYNYLTFNSLSLQNIDLKEVYGLVFPQKQIAYAIFQKAAQLYLVKNQEEGTYRVTMDGIVRYILSQMGELKQQYLKPQFEEVFKEMLNVFTPVNLKRPQQFPEISESFLFIKEHNEMFYYSKMSLPTTIKELISYMSKIKKKYSYNQIKGLMSHIFPDKSLQEALIKYFRKFGEQYQLKSLIVA